MNDDLRYSCDKQGIPRRIRKLSSVDHGGFGGAGKLGDPSARSGEGQKQGRGPRKDQRGNGSLGQ